MADLDVTEREKMVTLPEVMRLISKGEYRLPLLLSVVNQGVVAEKVFIVQDDWHSQ